MESIRIAMLNLRQRSPPVWAVLPPSFATGEDRRQFINDPGSD